MITRRDFLKFTGLSTLTVGSGYLTGMLTQNSKSSYYSIHGFIPEDEQIMNKFVSAFKSKVKSNSEPTVISNSELGEVINKIDLKLYNSEYSSKGNITYTLKKLEMQIAADVLVSDTNNSIYALEDINYAISNLRNELNGKKADYILTASYSETDLLSTIFKSNKKEAIIENEKGLVDVISLNRDYENIVIDGPQGKTGLKIKDGIMFVHKSTCRHEICKKIIAYERGNIIACAPNKILIRINTA